LSETPRHGSFTPQKVSYLEAGQPCENLLPFPKYGPDLTTIASHPTPKILARKPEQTSVTPKLCRDLTIISSVVSVNACVGILLVHRLEHIFFYAS
jgi:hypothetical protein